MTQAFVLRISPGGVDLVPESLDRNQIIIGWGVSGLLDEKLQWDEFRSILSKRFYSKEENLRKAGAASGHMWRFIRDMKVGDLVVVPYQSTFYVAKIIGQAFYDEDHHEVGNTYRRQVEWLNNKKSISRRLAKSALVSRMKTQGTCAAASDLLDDIFDCVKLSEAGRKPTFLEDLESRLVREALNELRSGRIDSFGFENLIRSVLLNLGATESRVVARSQDKGADILATFMVAGVFQQIVAVQAKHWQSEPPVGPDVVKQLIAGIEAEQAHLGMIVTSGTISDSAVQEAEHYFEEKGIRIELVDGEQFAKIIVEHGVGES